MDEWNDKNAEHFNVDVDKIEASAEKRVERKDFGSAERQNIQDSLAERQEDLAGTQQGKSSQITSLFKLRKGISLVIVN